MSLSIPMNPRQQEAVIHEGSPLLVLAGAGSGKTRVLTRRIVHFVRERGVSPWRFFAVTFTNKAAREMKHRVVEELGPEANDLWVSTFHSSCLRMLRRHAEALGYARDFAVYDTSDQQTVVKQILATKNLDEKTFKPSLILHHIDRAKNAGATAERFAAHGDYILTKVKDVYSDYQKELARNQAMDFGDLILNAILLFRKRPDILEEYRRQFQHILIDEYQDTNPVQYELIRLLAGAEGENLFVVGDDDQSIYRFRGAELKNILNFQKDYPAAKVIRLEQNYRSTGRILKASNAVIRRNAGRLGKELWTENAAGAMIQLFNGATDRDEAAFVARRIEEERAAHGLKGIAVFYRTNAQSRVLEDELRRRRIPYRIFGGMKFYERAEIKDALSYLRLFVNRSDGVAVRRVINVPARGIGKTTLDKIEQAAAASGLSSWQVLSDPENPVYALGLGQAAAVKLKSFAALVDKMDAARKDLPLGEFLSYVYEQTGYWQMLTAEKSVEAESRKENLTELVNVVEEFVDTNPEARLEDFLDQASLASDVDKLAEDEPFVTLMTVHLSKGLEFPVVFVVGLEEGLFPHARSLDKEEDVEEERRLCYVAMTRAMKVLHLCHAQERRLFGASKFNFPSRFLQDLPQDELEHAGEEEVPEAPSWRPAASPSGSWRAVANVTARKPAVTIARPSSPANVHIDRSYSQEEGGVVRSGMRVRHAVFGDGTVKSCEGSGEALKVTVRFSGGFEKKLSFKHANLQVV